MDKLFIKFVICDRKGQYVPLVSIECKHVNWHGMSDNGMLWDIVHSDGTNERINVDCEAYGDFTVSQCKERIVSISIVPWAYPVLSKDEFHQRFGKGMFIHPKRGHYVSESELRE